jgi:hypothetical protein
MSSRFMRENSQIIASILISSYAGICLQYKINSAYIWRSNYEFKNNQNVPMILSIVEEEKTRKVSVF